MKHNKALKITLIVLLSLLLVFCIASPFIVRALMNDTFSRTVRPQHGLTSALLYEDVQDRYPREAVSFPSGENLLRGHLYAPPAIKNDGLVVISHGLGGGEESYLPEALYFLDHGYQVLAYSNTGCWESEGENCVGLSQSVLDLDAALAWVESEPRFDGEPVYLFGHSWGGYAVAAVLAFGHHIAASASIAGFNDPMTMIVEWGGGMMGPAIYLEYPFLWLDQKLIFGETFGLTAVDAINSTDTPVMIIHGDNDQTVSYTHAGIIASRDKITNPNVEYYIRDKAPQNDHNHLFESLAKRAYADEKNAVYDELYQRYDGDIPEDVCREFCAGVDKFLANEPDGEFMARVLAFYQQAGVTEG